MLAEEAASPSPDQGAAASVAARGPRQIRRRTGPARLVVGAAALVAGVVAWELYARGLDSNLFVPTATQVAGALTDIVGTAEFWSAYRETLEPFLYGWVAAIASGVVLGLIVGRSRVVRRLTSPYVAFLNALPISTLVPVVVIFTGIGIVARSLVVYLFAIVDVVLTTAAGARYVNPDLVDMARSFGMSRVRRFRRVILPGSAAGIVAALRVGTGRAVVGMVVMELLLVSAGVGQLISRYKDGFRSAELYAVVVSLAVFGLALQALLRQAERRLVRWRAEPR